MKRKGRKPKLTESLIVQAEKLLVNGNFTNFVCEALGINRTTWYRWFNDGQAIAEGRTEDISLDYTPEMENLLYNFYNTVKKAEATGQVELVGLIQQQAKSGTWQAAAWILERKWRNYWGKDIPQTQDGESDLDKFLKQVEEVAENADEDYEEQEDLLDKQEEEPVEQNMIIENLMKDIQREEE